MLVALSPVLVGAQTTGSPGVIETPQRTVVASVDWQAGALEVRVALRIPDDAPIGPDTQERLRSLAIRTFPEVLFEALLPLQIDSLRTFSDALQSAPALAARVRDAAERAAISLPRPDTDLRGTEIVFVVPVFPDLSGAFVRHQIPFDMPRPIEWIPTREASGVVIYAADPLEHHGTNDTTTLRPALFPEIYDTDFRPVLERDMTDPAALDRWGVVAYTDVVDETPWRERIGGDPIRIFAERAFGETPTDIMISPADADRLLANDGNRALLREGRILVILPEGATTQSSGTAGAR